MSLPYIPEAVVRSVIAEIDGIKPQDVTWKRIAFEIAGLGGPTRRHIQVVPSAPTPEAVPIQDLKPPEQVKEASGEHSELIPTQPPVPIETIAAQIQRLRMECNWTIEMLTSNTGFDEKTVKRHLSGRSIPHLRNVTVYQRVFSKALKREVVINKMPPKRPPPMSDSV